MAAAGIELAARGGALVNSFRRSGARVLVCRSIGPFSDPVKAVSKPKADEGLKSSAC